MKTESLIHELSSKVSPVRPLAHPITRCVYWIFLVVPFVAIGTYLIGWRKDVADVFFNFSFLSQVIVLWFLFLAASSSAFFLSVPDTRRKRFIFFPGIILVSWLLVFIILLVSGSGAHVGFGLKCLRNIVLLSLPPIGLSIYLLVRAFPSGNNTSFLFSFLGASALACLATRFICPNDDLLHFFIWHCLPVIALSGIGILFGKLLKRNQSVNQGRSVSK